ncbi:hypothetical protein LCGC14_0765790 [marine sediment metagenome]|uniref:Uncharacterized protein n=1 Tax=marine sediment metagenome TaxID=412755 RepID=A0A0F9QJJ6_9ZZZZ
MRRKEKPNPDLNDELNIDEKIKAIRNILNSLEQVLFNLSPLLDKILLMDEANSYHKNGNFKTLIELFDTISKESKKLAFPLSVLGLPEEFYDMRN